MRLGLGLGLFQRRVGSALGTYSLCAQQRQPWQMLPEEMLSDAQYRRDLRAFYFDAQGVQRGGNMDIPAQMRLCVGQWKIDDYPLNYGTEVEVLMYFRPEQLAPTEDPLDLGRGAYVLRYQEWIRAGHDAPPIAVVEGDNGELRVPDGNRRLLAHKREGRPVPAWLSPSTRTGLTHSGSTQPIIAGATWETMVQDALAWRWAVPAAVRARYEAQLPRFENLRRRQRLLYEGATE